MSQRVGERVNGWVSVCVCVYVEGNVREATEKR